MFAIDTNLIAYAEGVGDTKRLAQASDVLDRIRSDELVIPAQALAELFAVLRRKTNLPLAVVRQKLRRWEELAIVAPTLPATLTTAFELATTHGLQIFDAIILAAASEAGCRMLLSEDLQDGFVWQGVTIANPFAAMPHPMLADLLRG